MLNKIVKTAAVITAFLSVAACLPSRTLNSSAASLKRPLLYTALGDSIATGYGLKDTAGSYTSLFAEYLGAKENNLAVNGLDSAGLLGLLGRPDTAACIRQSDIVTISIGGNDLLGVITKNMDAVKSGNIDVDSLINSLNTAETNFAENWPAVVRKIKAYSSQAAIIASTLINPYQGVTFGEMNLGTFADPYIQQINSVIIKYASLGYQISDSYAAFQNKNGLKLSNAQAVPGDLDPHPNAQGHERIFQTLRALKITVPSALRISGPENPAASPIFAGCSSYSAQSLISSSAGKIGRAVFSVETNSAEISVASGQIAFRKPGAVAIKACSRIEGTNVYLQGCRTVNAVCSAGLIVAGGAAAAAVFGAAAAALLIKKKRRRREPRFQA